MAPLRHTFHRGADAEAVAREAALWFVSRARAAVAARGRFGVALAGGSTPRRVYEIIAADARDAVEWEHLHVWFGDERCVPSDHAESNYRMASEALLSRVPLPAENIHRIIGEGDAMANARLYEGELRSFFNDEPWPALDLVLLGLGDDGHTASLFPHTHALAERDAWVAANWIEKLNAYRLTLTAPAINHAARVAFIVTGGAKANALAEVVEGPRDPQRLPAQLIRPRRGSLDWFVDEAASAQLRGGAGG